LVNEFSRRASLTENHKILAALPIRTFWTTNYDALIEESLRAAGKKPDVKATVESLATTTHRRDAVVYKMHGDVSLPDKAVVTKDDYESYDSTRHLFSMALQGDLVSKTFLFIGFSFSDPNLSYILSRIRILLGENRREHYCLLRKVQRLDFKKLADFRYAEAKTTIASQRPQALWHHGAARRRLRPLHSYIAKNYRSVWNGEGFYLGERSGIRTLE